MTRALCAAGAARLGLVAVAWALMVVASGAVEASGASPADRVAFAPAPGARLPLATAFTDERGHAIQLGDLFAGRPTLVVPAYYGCSNLCSVVQAGLADGLRRAGLVTGRDVDVVVFSIDALNAPADARRAHHALVDVDTAVDASVVGDGWHFLTAGEAAIATLTEALGYRYDYVAAEGQFAHAAGVVLATPDGRVARVLYGVSFPPDELRTALAIATSPIAPLAAPAPGRDLPGVAQRWLLCFHYDPHTGRYSFAAMNAVRSAGLLALCLLAGYVVQARRQERRKNRRHG